MRNASLVALLLLASIVAPAAAQAPTIEVNVEPSGRYVVQAHAPEMTFAGDIGQPVTNIRGSDGEDSIGTFHEIDFDYGARTSGIRAYSRVGATLFTTTYLKDAANADPFPTLTQLPDLPYKLSFYDKPFSPYQLNTLKNAADSPWLFFDASAAGFLISPAANFTVGRMELKDGSLSSGIDSTVTTLPAGFNHQTLLVVGSGLNRLFDTWGNALTALRGKPRPANDADVTLEKFGYWTDNGATYYYTFDQSLGYAGTLLNVRREFDQRNIALGYLQLDSWWYPKGAEARWDDKSGGIFRFRAAPDLFPQGLTPFQQQVGLPLVAHARWIDPASPYRSEFGFSGNVITDSRYWDDLMEYLHSGGVVQYEQDWLGAQAQPVYDLSAPVQFMGNMASAAEQRGMTMQYCMPLPRHVLQTTEYANLTTMRVSDDRFDRNRWDTFLYTSRLASALGVWPWSDVFMSNERNNLLLADLSAGVVGVGDALGAENADNIRHVMRADAVLVKPDAPLVPTDDSIVAEATQGAKSPMVAWAYSDHGALRHMYVFAYSRSGSAANVSVSLSGLGMAAPAYVYDYFNDSGAILRSGEALNASVSDGSYFVVAPVGPSGIAFLGDSGKFATLGQKRIRELGDDGKVTAVVDFAAGEDSVTLFGYAPFVPPIRVTGGAADDMAYSADSHRFSVVVHPDSAPGSVTVQLGQP